MTRKHFEQFADVCACIENRDDAKMLARVCVGIFEKANPRFDPAKFLRRGGFPENEVRTILEETETV